MTDTRKDLPTEAPKQPADHELGTAASLTADELASVGGGSMPNPDKYN